ncbi:MAG: hypothetical protein ACM30H_09880 [Clostridia bacterium]
MNKSMSFLAALACATLPLCALAQSTEGKTAAMQDSKPEVWVNAGMLSYHFDREKHYREFNYGVGAEAFFTPSHGVMVGTYKNSESQQSKYIGYQFRPWHWQPSGVNVHAGLALALLDGYPSMNDKGVFLAGFPFVAVEGKKVGANFLLIPNVKHGGAVAMQLKLKVW